jgi:hypothetical protein
MLFRLYTLYDKIAEEGGPIFQAKNDAVALRNFEQAMTAQHGVMHPEDFKLLCVGFYDSDLCIAYRLSGCTTSLEVTPNTVAADHVSSSGDDAAGSKSGRSEV